MPEYKKYLERAYLDSAKILFENEKYNISQAYCRKSSFKC